MSKPTRHIVDKTERIAPTPETALKLRPDPLASLAPAFQAIANEIVRTYYALCGKLNARAMQWEEGRAPSKSLDPIERIKDAQVARYVDWRKAMAKRHIKAGPVLDVLADMFPPYQVDKAYGLQPGTTAQWTLESLNIYRSEERRVGKECRL